MHCYYSINSNDSFVQYLKTKLGNNEKMITAMLAIANTNPIFRRVYTNFDKLSNSTKYDALSSFYYNKFGDGSLSITKDYDKNTNVGAFADSIERQYAISKTVGILQQIYMKEVLRSDVTEEELVDKKHFIDLAKKQMISFASQLAKKDFFESEDFAENRVEVIKALRDTNLTNEQRIAKALSISSNATHNFWSNVITELYSENANAFFDEVFNDPRLQVYNRELVSENEKRPADDNDNKNVKNVEGIVFDDIDDVDLTTSLWGDGDSGLYTNAMKHVDSFVRAYLGSLQKLKSSSKITISITDKEGNKIEKQSWDYDRDNLSGIPDMMNAEECVDIIYHRADSSSVERFVESIQKIADQQPGFESLAILADEMRNNDQFKRYMFKTFGKQLVRKTIVTYEDGRFVSRLSNPNTDRKSALRNEFRNDIKFTAISNNDIEGNIRVINDTKKLRDNLTKYQDSYDTAVSSLNGSKRINKKQKEKLEADKQYYLEKINETKEKIISNIANTLRNYFPNVKEKAIYALVADKTIGSQLNNINNVLATIDKLNLGALQSSYDYQSLSYDASVAWGKVRNLEKINEETGERNGSPTKIKEAYNEYYEIKKRNFINEVLDSAVVSLSEMLLPYTTVSSELNSPNVHGNLSSDVINSSYLTYLQNIVSDGREFVFDENGNVKINSGRLGRLAEYRFRPYAGGHRNHQYDFSNIMFEHGNVKGLFRILSNGTIIPTEYAKNLITIELFNGAQNNENEDAATYSEIAHNDFLASAFTQYFVPDVNAGINSTQFGNYFVRTQSDAPKTFVIRMPKYNTGHVGDATALLSPANVQDLNNRNRALDAMYNNVSVANPNKKNSISITLERATYLLTHDRTRDIPIYGNVTQTSVKEADGSTKKLWKVVYQSESEKAKGEEGKFFVMYFEGQKETKGKYSYLTNPKIHHVENLEAMPQDLRNAVYESRLKQFAKQGVISFNVNTNHIIFEQFRNAYMQELTDAGQQLYNLLRTNEAEDYITSDGRKVKRVTLYTENGDPVVKKIYQGEGVRKTYDRYHHNGGQILVKGSDGKMHLTGNVFKSDRFNKFDHRDITVRSYGTELLQSQNGNKPIIDFLYGGEENGLSILVDNEGNFIGIDITDSQKKAIDAKLSEFINDSVIDLQNRIGNAENTIDSNLRSFDDYVEFAVNYRNMYISMNDIIEGDTKFYKDGQDFLKRAKEGQAGGIPFGITDFNESQLTPTHVIDSVLGFRDDTAEYGITQARHTIKYTDKEGNIKERPIALRNRFTAITIANTIKISDDAKALESYLVRKGILNEEEAKEYIKWFDRTKTNDAQSYITFEEWVRRVTAMGEYERYAHIIEKICSEEELKPSEIKQFIQVQKNFYYDQYYNENFNTVVSRQIKNAEFVLIPQLLNYVDEEGNTQRTDLGKLYDFMVEKGIDQINTAETSKAAKANILTLWDNEGVANWNSFIEQFSDKEGATPVEEFSYNFLYRQQEVPQHVDAFNKAGIQIMKKLIDNIPDLKDLPADATEEQRKLSSDKEQFIKDYCANIKSSFTEFGRMLEMAFDSNGNLKVDENGRVQINKQLLYGKLRDEARRLGVNSNELEYLTLNEDGTPLMPSEFTIFVTKFENIVQSLINKVITRQTLPGFHAAQVTGLGISEKFSGRNGQIKTAKEWKGNKLRYHPINEKGEAEAYIEVVVPRFKIFDGLTDEEIFTIGKDGKNMLERAGLDKFIGYRIPTEGKQSVAVMKIVGFVDKVQGSTIIVPDDWVAQTGADFDVDSIYAINFNMFKDRRGNITRAHLKTGVERQHVLDRYQDYVRQGYKDYKKNYDLSYDKYDNSRRKEAIDAYNKKAEEYDRIFNEIVDKEGRGAQLYNSLPTEYKNIIKEINQDNSKTFSEQLIDIIDALEPHRGKNAKLDSYLNLYQKYLSLSTGVEEAKVSKRDKLSTQYLDEKEKYLNDQAEVLGLMTFDDFAKLSIEEQNSRDARNADILDRMLNIASSPLVLEETISQSNFRDVVDARDWLMSKEESIKRKNRSPYDVFDQFEYQEEAMNGAILKAFSVSRDTFASVCNKVKPTVSKGFNVIYEEIDKNGKKRTKEELLKHFDYVYERNINLGGGKHKKVFMVGHNKIGWSKDNRNVDGKHITIYSSQTTAYHLDAIKEGGIPNLNTLTFGVYKTIVDMGSDYLTAVGFVMQPGVKRIVDAYNRSRSIFNKDFNTVYVDTAIKDIAKELDFKINNLNVTEYSNIDDVLETFNQKEVLDQFKKQVLPMFGLEVAEIEAFKFEKNNSAIYNLPFSSTLFKDRLDNSGVFKDNELAQKLFDLAIILQYHSMSGTAETITNYAAVCSPDKFGAKQSIFATQKVFDDIQELLNRGKNPKDIPLWVPVKNVKTDMLKVIYPGIEEGIDKFVTSEQKQSSYPSLYYFLKYASGTSMLLSKELFKMQREDIRKALYAIADKNHLGININEDLYNEFKQYVLSDGLYTSRDVNDSSLAMIQSDEDAHRILGYGKALNVDFEPENINKPTDEEKAEFDNFTPAQKVMFIKRHFSNGLIFNHLSANTINSSKTNRLLPQVISFNYDNVNIEVALDLFRQAYYNDNYYLRQGVLDLIKYALVAESFKMKRNGISKIIANNVLRDSGYADVLDVASNEAKDNLFDDRVYTNFIRSHSDKVKLFRVKSGNKIDRIPKTGGYYSPIFLGSVSDENSLGVETGLVDEKGNYNAYIRFKDNNNNEVLMKAMLIEDELYYYPVSKLDAFEHTNWSANQDYNIGYYDEEGYIKIIEDDTIDQAQRREFVKEHAYERKKSITTEESFDINDFENHPYAEHGFKDVIRIITENSKKNLSGIEPGVFFFSSTLAGIGPNAKTYVNKSTEQTINGNKYIILRISPKDKINFIPDLTKHSINWYLKKLDEGKTEVLDGLNPSFVECIEKIYSEGVSNPIGNALKKSLFLAVAKPSTTSRKSTLADLTAALIGNINEDSRNHSTQNSYYTISNLRKAGITRNNMNSINENLNKANDIIRKFVVNTAKDFEYKVNHYPISTNAEENVSIDDEKVINRMITDREYRDNILKFVLDYDKFVRKYRIVEQMYSTDISIKANIDEMNAAVKKLMDPALINKLDTVRKAVLTEYVSTISTDPLIQDMFFEVTDGFNNVSMLESWLSDSMEAGIPLLQVVGKDVLGDIEAKTMQGRLAAAENTRFFEKIENDARLAGMNVNYDNIIDPYGRFYRDYIDELEDILYEKRDKLRELSLSLEGGVNNPEYIRAKYDYDFWYNKNFNQYEAKEYHDAKLANKKALIDSIDGRGIEVLAEYNRLNDEIRKIRDDVNYDKATEEDERKLVKLQNQLNALLGRNLIDGTPVIKKSLSEGVSLFNSKEASDALAAYLNKELEINAKYFDKQDIEAFNNKLNECLAIMKKYEKRPDGGIYSEDVLMQNEEYAKAAKWVRYNARLVINDDALRKKLSYAYDILRKEAPEPNKKSNYRGIVLAANAEDVYGIVNGMLFSKEQIAAIKRDQVNKFNYNIGTLIKPILNDGIIYRDSFYDVFQSGVGNARWKEQVVKINSILEKAYDRRTKRLNLSILTIKDLNTLAKLYEKLNNKKLKHKIRSQKAKDKIKEFIDDNVEFETDYKVYEAQLTAAKLRNQTEDGYLEAWLKANTVISEDESGIVEQIPNPFLYSTMKPKGDITIERDSEGYITKIKGDKTHKGYINVERTNAAQTIRNNTRDVITHYYWEAMNDAQKNGTFDEWYDANHIYNPYSNSYTPIQCWIRQEYINADKEAHGDDSKYSWEPKHERYTKRLKDSYKNIDYKKGKGMSLANYRKGGDYDNTSVPVLNEYEKKVKDKMMEIIQQYTFGEHGQQIVDKGIVPTAADSKTNAKWFAKQFGGLMGVYDNREHKEFYTELDWDKYPPIEIPMMDLLKGKVYKDGIEIKTKKEIQILSRNQYSPEAHNDVSYEDYVNDIRQKNKQIRKDNLEVHKELISKDWKKIFSEFTVKGSRTKAIDQNKAMLYFALDTLRNMEAYKNPLGFANLLKNKFKSTDEEAVYSTEKMDNAVELLQTLMRRLLYNQRKKNNGMFTKIGDIAQSSSSARFMIANITGGTTNVTYGETQIWKEAIARQYFGKKEWSEATADYARSIPSFMHDMFTDNATSKFNAMVKLMNVVDLDTIVELSDLGVEETVKKVRNMAYGLSSGGEHMMQNKVLRAMMGSHRIEEIRDADNKLIDVKIITEELYNRKTETKALNEILDKYNLRDTYNNFLKRIKSDKNKQRKYVERHLFLTDQFFETLTDERRNEIIKDYISTFKNFKEERKKQFKSLKTFYDQFKIDDNGYANFEEGSAFAELIHNDETKKEDVWRKIGNFRNKVVYVNKKIHGVYDQIGAARLEQEWYGSVAMQFHKHIYPGLMKRWRKQGYYNEVRESVEKGSNWSLIDFLNVNTEQLATVNNLSKEELDSLNAIQRLFMHATDYLTTYGLRWELIPEYEKANIIRNFTDYGFLVLAVGISVAARLAWDERDKKDSLAYNYIMNAIDRTEMELMLYTLYGAVNETKTLWRNPVAVSSTIEDLLKIMGISASYILEGPEGLYYKSGVHTGENKLFVLGTSLIPGYRAVNHFRSLPKNNNAYKLQANFLQNWSKNIASAVANKEITR